MIIFCVGLACAICATDLILKEYVEHYVIAGEEQELAGGRIKLRKVYNKGMALSVLEKYPKYVRISSAVTGVGLALYEVFLFLKKGRHVEKIGIAMMLGGACSNLYDRFVRNQVIDYIGVRSEKKKLEKLTFNIGDVFLVIGSVFTIIGSFVGKIGRR